MDGLLIVDKPVGPSSHDVVARVRRVLREPRIGHTGTLDPAASGVLALVVGRATRLARFLSGDSKAYTADIRFGFSTNTYDAVGRPTGERYEGLWPERTAIEAALDGFRGTFLQMPPAYSAKKLGGEPSYKLARRADKASSRRPAPTNDQPPPATPEPQAPVLTAVQVTTSAVEIVETEADRLTLHIECSAGFYVRSLAHDLGELLGTGAHLLGLRRTRSGEASIDGAIPLDRLESVAVGGQALAAAALVPMSRMLTGLPTLTLTVEGFERTRHGRDLRPSDFTQNPVNLVTATSAGPYRVLGPDGSLVAIAGESPSGLLHPSIVLM